MRVLLLEFAALGRFHRGFQLPFLKGYLKVRHVDVRWIRFGLDPDVRSRVGETGMSLEDADLSRLEQILGESDYTHVVCSRAPSCTVLGTIRRVLPGVPVGHVLDGPQVGETDPRSSEPVSLEPSVLARFFDMAHTAGANTPIVETEVPDFGWEAANRAAATEQSRPFLLCGTECDYRKTLASNPHYESLDLSGCHRTDGCAFCVRPADNRRPSVDSVALFRRQLEALARTHPAWRGRLAVRAVGVPILGNIEAIAGALCDCSVGPVDLLLDGRADRILKVQDPLRRALDRVSESKHGLSNPSDSLLPDPFLETRSSMATRGRGTGGWAGGCS